MLLVHNKRCSAEGILCASSHCVDFVVHVRTGDFMAVAEKGTIKVHGIVGVQKSATAPLTLDWHFVLNV